MSKNKEFTDWLSVTPKCPPQNTKTTKRDDGRIISMKNSFTTPKQDKNALCGGRCIVHDHNEWMHSRMEMQMIYSNVQTTGYTHLS